ncbi:MAG: sterol desaturase family protein [Betaproteobacteria bacterium]|nr:sterol desaturase family protein [Betaproteobacteria bacterium]
MLYAVPVFLSLIFVELLVAKWMGRKVYCFHDAITSINIGLMSECVRSLLKLMSVFVYAVVVEQVGAFTWDVGQPAVWILAFFMYDFFYYWAHRAGHEVNFLWAAHVVHHSSEEFNLSTALRQSSTNQVFYWVFYLPMAIVGIPVAVFVLVALASALYQFWVHTRLIPKLGWLDLLFSTPSNHRCHHGRNPYCIDVNYGATLIIWDRMFGTYVAERDDEPVVYGTLAPLQSWNPVWANFKNYIGIVRDATHAPRSADKLMHVFAGPDWTPAGPAVPEQGVARTYAVFETPSSRWQRVYGVVATVVVFAMFMHLLMVAPGLSVAARIGYGLLIALNGITIGQIFSNQQRAIEWEALRVAAVFGALASGLWFTPVHAYVQTAAGLGLAISLLVLVFARSERGSMPTAMPEARA